MYVVSVGPVLMIGIEGLFAMMVVMVVAVIMLRRDASIVMVMDVRVISSTVAMVNRAHDRKRKLLLRAATTKRDRSVRWQRLQALAALVEDT